MHPDQCPVAVRPSRRFLTALDSPTGETAGAGLAPQQRMLPCVRSLFPQRFRQVHRVLESCPLGKVPWTVARILFPA